MCACTSPILIFRWPSLSLMAPCNDNADPGDWLHDL